MRILQSDAVCAVIDFQERLTPAIEGGAALLARTRILLEGLNVLQVPLLVTRQYPKGLGDTVLPIKEVTENAPVLDKIAFGCWDEPSFRAAIEQSGCKTVLLCGIETHICVLQTLIGLREAGYRVVLIEDCCGARRAQDSEIALRRAAQEGAIPASFESVLFELARAAGTDRFKQISKLVK